jgi:hypothetical protein
MSAYDEYEFKNEPMRQVLRVKFGSVSITVSTDPDGLRICPGINSEEAGCNEITKERLYVPVTP